MAEWLLFLAVVIVSVAVVAAVRVVVLVRFHTCRGARLLDELIPPPWVSAGHYSTWTSRQLRDEVIRSSRRCSAAMDELIRREAASGTDAAERHAQGGESI